MSSLVAFRMWRGQVSHIASTSRCVVAGALGLPVVPEVKASSAMSSAAVGQAAKTPLFTAAIASSASGASDLKASTRRSTGFACWEINISSMSFASHSATTGLDFSTMSFSSRARSKGIVATAISPAFTTASHASAIGIELPPRSSTRLPGTSPRSSVSTCAMRFTSTAACA